MRLTLLTALTFVTLCFLRVVLASDCRTELTALASARAALNAAAKAYEEAQTEAKTCIAKGATK